ncbi:MAG: AraC family transcriptional regulator [Archangiaceae bacterium]|nr:AraC family transcriptional regulator [Archangiaceae bacterium]
MGDVVELGFRSSVRPGLGFEVMRFSELRRRTLTHALDGLTRPQFHLVAACLTGRTRHRVDFERHLLRPRDLVFVAPGRVQGFDPTPGLELSLLLFTPEFLQLSADPRLVDPLRGARVLSPFWKTPVLNVPKALWPDVTGLISQLEREYARPADGVQTAVLSSLLRALLLQLERLVTNAEGASTAPPALERFRETLEQGLETSRSVEHYARLAKVTPRTLNRLTLRHLGVGAKQTIDTRVVLELKRLLAYSDLSVKELSARFGFDEPTNLVKFFKRHTGTTPQRFRDAR